jgi:hypothetical protein
VRDSCAKSGAGGVPVREVSESASMLSAAGEKHGRCFVLEARAAFVLHERLLFLHHCVCGVPFVKSVEARVRAFVICL